MCHAAVVTNTHDDTAGLQVIQSRNATDEAGNQTAFFTLALASELVIPATFGRMTSMVAQKVVVSGVDVRLRRLMASGAG